MSQESNHIAGKKRRVKTSIGSRGVSGASHREKADTLKLTGGGGEKGNIERRRWYQEGDCPEEY